MEAQAVGFWDYLQAMIVIAAVIAAAFYLTRLVAKTGGALSKGTGIRLVASQPLGKDKSVAVVEIAGTAYILGCGGQRVELIDKIPASELKIEAPPAPSGGSFSASFREELAKRLRKFGGSQ
jgi:flagellar biosynthetic protein FliO